MGYFSDILNNRCQELAFPSTLLNSGDHIEPPIRSLAQIDKLHPLEPEESPPFYVRILQTYAGSAGDAVLWVPLTPAAYAIEGKSSKDYNQEHGFQNQPCCITLGKIADAIVAHVRYQIDSTNV